MGGRTSRRNSTALPRKKIAAVSSLLLASEVQGAAFLHSSPSAVDARRSTERSSFPAVPKMRYSVSSSLPASLSPSWNSTIYGKTFAMPETAPLIALERPSTAPAFNYRVFCDLDGVLVDFACGVSRLFGDATLVSHNIDAMPRSVLWDRVRSADTFFETLPWCEGGRELWAALAPLRPDILTGVPSYCHTAPRAEKFAWCARELGGDAAAAHADARPPATFRHVDKAGRFRAHSAAARHEEEAPPRTRVARDDGGGAWNCCRVITCWSECKHHESGPGVVLIDDRIDLRAAWEAKGGIFIHHVTGDVSNTLQQLREHGILPPTDDAAVTSATTIRDGKDHGRLWHHLPLRP